MIRMKNEIFGMNDIFFTAPREKTYKRFELGLEARLLRVSTGTAYNTVYAVRFAHPNARLRSHFANTENVRRNLNGQFEGNIIF